MLLDEEELRGINCDVDDHPLKYIIPISATLSAVGAICVVKSIFTHRKIVMPRHKILCMSAIFDILSSLAAASGYITMDSTAMCAINGLFIGWSLLSSLIMTTSMAFHTCLLLIWKVSKLTTERFFWLYGSLVFIAFIENIIFSATGQMDIAGSWCWLKSPSTRMIDLYVPAWILMTIGLILTYLLFRKWLQLNKEKYSTDEAKEFAGLHLHIIKTTLGYQMVELIMYAFATAFRIGQTGNLPCNAYVPLQYLHDIGLASIGYLTAIVYFIFDSPKRNRENYWSLRKILSVSHTFDIFVQYSERKHGPTKSLFLWKELYNVQQYTRDGDPIWLKDVRNVYTILREFHGQDIMRVSVRRRINEFIDENKGSDGEQALKSNEIQFMLTALEDVQNFIRRKLYWKFLDSPEWEIFCSSDRFQVEVLSVAQQSPHYEYENGTLGKEVLLKSVSTI